MSYLKFLPHGWWWCRISIVVFLAKVSRKMLVLTMLNIDHGVRYWLSVKIASDNLIARVAESAKIIIILTNLSNGSIMLLRVERQRESEWYPVTS